MLNVGELVLLVDGSFAEVVGRPVDPVEAAVVTSEGHSVSRRFATVEAAERWAGLMNESHVEIHQDAIIRVRSRHADGSATVSTPPDPP